jgi:Protein kinase domain
VSTNHVNPPSSEDGGAALPVGSLLADFEVQRVIGEGGFGIVYLARDVHLERLVAVKEYMPTSLATRKADEQVTVRSQRHRETFELGRRSFINEAKLLAQLDHPSLVKVLRYWEDRGTAYMAMPYYQGDTLKQRLQQPGAQPPTEAWLRALLMPMLDALEHLHARDLLHRDIAPDNIMLLPSGAPLLLDFGAARHVIGDATQALTVILKPGYAPIEQYAEAASMRQGPWTDLYALAAVMYGAVSGKPPQASVARVLKDDLVPAAVVGAGRYSSDWLAWIDRCMAVRPDDRPPHMAAARALLLTPTVHAQNELDSERMVLVDERTVIRPAAFVAAAAAATAGTTSRPTSPWQGLTPDGDEGTVLQPSTTAAARPTATVAPAVASAATRERKATGVPSPSPRSSTTSRAWLVGVGALAVAVLGAGAWWWSTPVVPIPAEAAKVVPSPNATDRLPTATVSVPAPPMQPAAVEVSPTPAPATQPSNSQPTASANPDDDVPKPATKPKPKPRPDAPPKVQPQSDAYGAAADTTKPTARPTDASECAALLQRASMGDTSPALMARLQAARCR